MARNRFQSRLRLRRMPAGPALIRPPFARKSAAAVAERRRRAKNRERMPLGLQSLEPRYAMAAVLFDPGVGQKVIAANAPTGGSDIVKQGLGTLVLDKAGTFTGGTSVDQGQLVVRNASALGSGGLTVKAGAAVTVDVVGSRVSVGGLTVESGGRLDLGYGGVTVASGGYSLSAVQGLLRQGYVDDWSGTTGITTRSAGGAIGDNVGYIVNSDEGMTVGYAANGDTNLDGVVDIMDLARFATSGKVNNGSAATWADGDFNHDGVVDLLDTSSFLSESPFDRGAYVPSATASVGQVSADSSTSAVVAVGSGTTGTIGSNAGRNWYRVSLEAGTNYRFSVTGDTLAESTLFLRDAAGIKLASAATTFGITEIVFLAPTTGDYFLDVGGYDATGGASSGGSGGGVFSTAPGDFFATGDGDFTAVGEGLFAATGAGGVLTLGHGSFTATSDTTPNAVVSGSATGTFTLQATTVLPDDDFAADATTVGSIAVGDIASGVIGVSGDRDWFRVALKSGSRYKFNLDGVTLADPQLVLRNTAGVQLAVNDDTNGKSSEITFTATATGDYFLDAGGTGSSAGSYTLTAADVTVADDYAGNATTTGTVAVDGSTTGVVNVANDRDWFGIPLVAGRTYRFTLDGTTLADPLLKLRSSNGTELASNDNYNGANSQITFTAATTGTYFLDAGSYDDTTGAYRLAVRDLTDWDEFPGGFSTTGGISIGSTVTSVVNVLRDRDWLVVNLVAGNTYRFNLDGVTLADPNLILWRWTAEGGTMLAINNDKGGLSLNSEITWTALESGPHYLDAGSFNNAGIGSYSLTVTDISNSANDDFGGSTASYGTLAVGGSVPGVINYLNDKDWFRVELGVGVYRFNVWGVGGTAGLDSNLQLRDSAGNSISPTTATFSDNWNILDPEVTFRCAIPGVYFLEVTGAPVAPSGLGGYVVTAVDAQVTGDDFAGTYESTATVTVGGVATGTISANGDRDWFKVNLEVGLTYQISVVGGTLDDPNVYLRTGNALARQQAYNDNYSGRNSQITFKAKATTAYFIDVGAAGGSLGTYTVSVAQVVIPPPPGDDFAGSNSTLGVVAVGGSVTGVIGADADRDWFRVQLVAGRKYTFNVAGETLRDPDLYIRASTGSNFGYMDNTGGSLDPTTKYSPSSTGTYFIDVGSAGDVGSGTYTLNVTEVLDGDDFGSNSQTNGRLAIGRSLLGAIESYGDSDWFRVELEGGTKYRFSVKGGEGEFNPASLRVHNADGVRRAGNFYAWGTTTVDFVPSYTGTFYLNVGSYCVFQLFPYRVTASILSTPGADDFAGDATTTGGLSDQEASTGAIGFAGDRDWFRTYLVAGRTYQFDLKGSSLTDPSLSLRSTAGRVLSTNDDYGSSRDSRIVFTPTLSGMFFLDVGAGATGTGIGTYTLSLTDVSDLDRITGIQDVSIRTAVQAALTDNLFSQQELAGVLRTAGTGGVTAQELADLRRIGISLQSFLASESRSYLQYVFTAVVGGNRANQYWTGGTTTRVALGNLQAGSTKEQMDLLVDKWFGGKDLPGNAISGDAAAGQTSVAAFAYAPMTGPLFVNGASWTDIGQGAAGTCYLLAGLATVAQARTDIVTAMFRDNGDGTYGVRFYGTLGSEIWVTVNSDIPVRADGITRLLGGDRSGSIVGEKWVALAEKAYAQANEIGLFSRPFAINSYKAIEGGVQTVLTHLSGVPDRTFAFSGMADSAARENVATWNSYQSVVVQALASGSSGWIGSFGNRIDPWTGKRTFVSNHAYAIVGYDAQTDRFKVSNPWGAGGGGWIGTFEVTWTDLRSFSCVVAIA